MSVLSLGQWDGIVRAIAGHNFDRAQRVACWPVVEVLHAYMDRMRKSAADSYRHRVIVWALTAPHSKNAGKPPSAPAILDE